MTDSNTSGFDPNYFDEPVLEKFDFKSDVDAVQLFPHHLADLRRSGLTDETIAKAGIFSMSAEKVAAALGWQPSERSDGCRFPYDSSKFYRVKLHPPVKNKDDVMRYWQPSGSGVELYVPKAVAAILSDPTSLLAITEGEKKTLALCQAGIPTIGLSGLWGWSKDGQLIPELERILTAGRTIDFYPDSDVWSRPELQQAVVALAWEARRRESIFRVVVLTPGPKGEKRGADDFLVQEGLRALEDLSLVTIDDAPLADHVPWVEARRKKMSAEALGAIDPLTDIGNGHRFAFDHGFDVRYSYPQSSWFIRARTEWIEDKGGERIEKLAKETVHALFQDALQIGDDARRRLWLKHAMASAQDHKLKAMIHQAQSEPGISIQPEQFNADPWLLNVRNGTIDLRTGKLRPHDRLDYITKTIPIDYDPEAECPEWMKFLRVRFVDQDTIDYVQRCVGYSLTGRTGEQVFFLVLGRTNTGKSTFMTVIALVVGPYGVRVGAETLIGMSQAGQARSDVVRLFGVRAAVASEMDKKWRFNEAFMKGLTGQDKVVGRQLYKPTFEFDSTTKIWLATNVKPEASADPAFHRRVRIITCDVPVKPSELIKDFPEHLKAMGELPGILIWAVRGCLAWQQKGLDPPTSVVEAGAAYAMECDLVQLFTDDCCAAEAREAPLKTTQCRSADLWGAFKTWCAENGHKLMKQSDFNEALEGKGFIKDRERSADGRKHVWRGLKLRSTSSVGLPLP